jgi:hypothetical protein
MFGKCHIFMTFKLILYMPVLLTVINQFAFLFSHVLSHKISQGKDVFGFYLVLDCFRLLFQGQNENFHQITVG